MPNGLELNQNEGSLNGTVRAEATTYTFTLRASNNLGSTEKTFYLKVLSGGGSSNNDNGVEDEEKKIESIRNLFNGRENLPIKTLPLKKEEGKKVPDSWNEEENGKPVAVLPEISVTEEGIYLIDISFDTPVQKGTILVWYSSQNNVKNSAYLSTENDEYHFLDENGEKLSMPLEKDIGGVTVAAYFEANQTYSPLIATQTSSSNQQSNQKENSEQQSSQSSGGGGGCNFGMSAITVLLLCSSMMKICKKYLGLSL